MIDNAYYSQDLHGPYELHDIGNLDLEEGGTLRGCKLAVATFGTLNAARDNAILVPTWYSGTNKIMDYRRQVRLMKWLEAAFTCFPTPIA